MITCNLRTLFITATIYPPVGGVALRNIQNISIFSTLGSVHVFSISRDSLDASKIDHVETWFNYNVNSQNFLWRKLENLILWLRKTGLWDYWPYRYSAVRHLNKCITEFNPDLIVVEELWLYLYLSTIRQHNCPVIFDNHNVESLLFKETKCNGNGWRGWLRSLLHLPQIRADERHFMEQATQTWVCSDQDQALLQEMYGQHFRCYVVPNAINLQYYDLKTSERGPLSAGVQQHPKSIVFMGNFGYIPNAEAAETLIQDVYPKLKANYPDCRLFLVGRAPTELMIKASSQHENIVVTGLVPDVRPYLAAAAVMVNPLYKGSGTRFKVLEAFASRCPVISTTKGVEGLQVNDGEHLLIRDNTDDMIVAIMQIWSHPEQFSNLTQAGYALVEQRYSWEAVSKHISEAIGDLFPQLRCEASLIGSPFLLGGS